MDDPKISLWSVNEPWMEKIDTIGLIEYVADRRIHFVETGLEA